MRKKTALFVLASLIYFSAFSQDGYFVKNNGDTVICKFVALKNLPNKKFFGGFKEAKNVFVYKTLDNKDKQEISVDEIAGIKDNNLPYCVKKKLVRYHQDKKYGVDAIYDFFPLENGRFQRNTMQIINKDSIRFYKIADEMNASSSPGFFGGGALGGALAGASFGFRDVPYAYYVEKANSGELFELPRKANIGANILDGWKLLKELLTDNPNVIQQLDLYISDNKKATKSNIEAIILSYTGIKFDDLPKSKTGNNGVSALDIMH
ncbi:MAG: hypothetical protein DI598_12445 [Pseudopedobacter saltans]|uniref:Uncharacterized protein n=1 Tax=Pseudopedobacter saltans TaxID=151895 RepID=A0A2W5EW44_9SPHI|nr:MAG: hypothetical protein DI598_12445 [Pseudopedobacter saltans]